MNNEDKKIIEEIRKIVARGNNVEVRGAKDGSLKIYEVKLKKTIG